MPLAAKTVFNCRLGLSNRLQAPLQFLGIQMGTRFFLLKRIIRDACPRCMFVEAAPFQEQLLLA